MIKRSVSIKGHRTSIALEAEFWATLEYAAHKRAISLPRLIGEIDRARLTTSGNLASALRVYALKFTAESGGSAIGDKTERGASKNELGI